MVSLIWAWDENKLIGKNNELPWYYPQDLAYFKELTRNKTVIMGRKTYDSIIERNHKPLPKRINVVVTHRPIHETGVIGIDHLESYLKSHSHEDIFIIGGKQLFQQALPYADRLYITVIHQKYEGDVYLTDFSLDDFHLISSRDENELSFTVYERKC